MGLFSGFFSSRFEIDEPSRQWIAEHLRWLQNEFGEDRIIERPIIEPTDAFFPDPYDQSTDAIAKTFHRVCDYMDVPPDTVKLQVMRQDQSLDLVGSDGISHGIAGGLYEEDDEAFLISLDEAALCDPMRAIATLAHELSHARLLGENRIDPQRFDHELLTDLCADFFGFGVFAANCPAYAPPGRHVWPGTNIGRTEYMSLHMHAYTLALIANMRFESNPGWARHLKGGAKAEFKAAMKMLA